MQLFFCPIFKHYGGICLMGRLYRRRYSFFLRPVQKTLKILVDFGRTDKCYTSIETLKCLFFLCTLTNTTKLCGFGKKKENKQDALSVFSISASCSSKYVTKMKCNSAKTQHTDMGVISIESWKCLL